MKHLKVRAELSKNQESVNLVLLQQTHYDEDFGKSRAHGSGQGNTNAFVHNGYSLVSHYNNDFRRGRGVMAHKWLLVPTRPAGKDKVTVSLDEWNWMKPLIQAYNEWGATQ